MVSRRRDPNIQCRISALLAVFDNRKVNRLQKEALLVGHDRRDDIDHLREIGHLDDVGVTEERIEEHPHRQRIFEVVDLLELFAIAGAVPDIPFIVGNVDRTRVWPSLHLPNQAGGYIDVIIDGL